METFKHSDGARLLVFGLTVALVPVSAVAAWVAETPIVTGLVISLAFAGLGVLGLVRKDGFSCSVLGLGLIGQPMALTAALSGHPWQVDMHMLFFAALAVLVVLVDVRSILIAAVAVVVHHSSLSIVLPTLIYPEGTGFASALRTLLHGTILGIEAGALVFAVKVRERMIAEAEKREAAVRTAMNEAWDAQAKAEAALGEAERQRLAAEEALETARAAQSAAETERSRASEIDRKSREATERELERRTAEDTKRQRVMDMLNVHLALMADGDLSSDIDVEFPKEFEELRHDFNGALLKLRDAIDEVAGYAEDIGQESSEITSAAHDLSKRTEHQAATLAETAAAIEELTRSVKSAADAASTAALSAADAQSEAMKSGDIVEQAILAMGRIEERSGQIARINRVIEDIAFQTNLLALNAGVEAARAGDAGRGFAVVASEVRALAQRSSDAAREISQLIEASGAEVSQGVDLVNKTGAALGGIVEAVNGITARVGEIANSAAEQSKGFSEINQAVADLDHVTQRNSAMFEETTAASSRLSTLAGDLRQTMERFKTRTPGTEATADVAWRTTRLAG